MTHYPDIILDPSVSLGTSGGPRVSVKKLYTAGGKRKTNELWDRPLIKMNLRYGVRHVEALYEVLRVFYAVGGPAHTFMLRDWMDWNSTEGFMGVGHEQTNVYTAVQPMRNTTDNTFLGDGATTIFQPVKAYSAGSVTKYRDINGLVDQGNLIIEVNSVVQGSADYQVNADGTVTFSSAPLNSQTVLWGGTFNIIGAFESEEFIEQTVNIGKDGTTIISAPNIPVEEVRDFI